MVALSAQDTVAVLATTVSQAKVAAEDSATANVPSIRTDPVPSKEQVEAAGTETNTSGTMWNTPVTAMGPATEHVSAMIRLPPLATAHPAEREPPSSRWQATGETTDNTPEHSTGRLK